jgi:PST family polysaccharide transporter
LPKEQATPGEEDLARTAAGGVMWQGLSYFSGKALVLVSTAILARLLSIDEFGLVGFALVFITYAEVLTDLGVAQALVYFPEEKRRNDAALALCLISSAVLVLVAFVAAPAIARFFEEPEVTDLFRVLSLSLFFAALGQVPDALIRKELRFRNRLITDLTRSVAQGVVSVSLAIAGFGAWAIVYGYLAANLARSIASWLLVDYRPSAGFLRYNRDIWRPLLRYGSASAANGLLLSLVFNIDYLIVGKMLGKEALAFYTLAFRLPQMAIINIFHVLSAVAFPMFSRVREDLGRLRRGYVRGVRLQTVFGVGAGVTLAAVAPMLIEVVFGVPKWSEAIVPLQALSLYASFRSLGIGAVDLYKGMGRPGLALWLSVIRLTVLLPALLVATDGGIDTVSWTQAGVALALAVMMQVVAARILEMPVSELMRALLPSFAVGLAAAVGGIAVRLWFPGPALVRLIVGLAAAGVCALGALWATDRSLLAETLRLLRRKKG